MEPLKFRTDAFALNWDAVPKNGELRIEHYTLARGRLWQLSPPRTWRWWLWALVGTAWLSAAAWIVYRTLAGHPVMGGLLSRLGG